jgi:hypothetical protein
MLGRALLLVTLVFFAGASAAAQPAGAGSKRHALLIGIGQYRTPGIAPLLGAVNDVRTIERLLVSRYEFPPDSIRLLTDAQATRAAIIESLRRLAAEAGASDAVYIHFSGYGSQVKDVGGDEKSDGLDETILPHDAREDGIADITDDELGEALSAIKSASIVVVLDSSHSGTGTRGTQAVRERSAPPDTRLSLYERVVSRDVVPIEESYVLFGAAAAGQPALDVPVDGRVHGLFSYAFSRTLARLRRPTPKAILEGVKVELRRVQEQLGRRSMPRPQLEVRWDLLDRPLFAGAVLAGGAARAAEKAPPRKAWLEVRPVSETTALLAGGAEMFGVKDSLWAIYPPGETVFRAREGVATGRVVEARGSDSVLRIVSRVKAAAGIPPGARAVPISSPGPDRVPVRLGRMTGEQREKIGEFLTKRLGAVVEVAAEDQFARFVVDRGGEDPSLWEISDGTGLGPIETFEETGLDKVTENLEDFLVRSQSASELLALENMASSLELDVEVYRPAADTAQQLGEKGIQLVPDLESPRYRIRREGDPRSPENSLQLAIRVSAPAYLTIVDVDPEGKVNVLFPNPLQGPGFYADGLVPAGSSVLIPDSLEGGNLANFFFDYSPPSGLDTIRVFAAADLETARRIRDFAFQVNDELGSLGEIAAFEDETGTRAVGAPISFDEMRRSLARPRGIIVVADTPEAPEIIDTDPAALLDPLEDLPLLEEPLEGVTPPVDIPPVEPLPLETVILPVGPGGEVVFLPEPAIPGDWTAVSITILVEE